MLLVFLVLFIITPLLPLLPFQHWTIRFFDFVRLQSVLIQAVLLILALIFWKPMSQFQGFLVLSLLATMIYQFVLIIPYTQFYTRYSANFELREQRFRLLTANVLQTNTSYDKLITLIKEEDPDVVLTMESNAAWDEALSHALASYTHHVKATLENFYGMHLYSRIPLDKSQVLYLVEEEIPSIHVQLKVAGQAINLIGIHPAPPSPSENETSKERDAELMIVGKRVRSYKDPTIVCGDLNDVVWSKVSRRFTKMTGFFDPRVGRGLYPTFHAQYRLMRFPLDHLFYSKGLFVPNMKRLRSFDSDHFAMFYEIAVAQSVPEVPKPTLDSEEKEEIKKTIIAGFVQAKKK